MSNVDFFIDTNIPMHALGSQHPLKQPCIQVLADVGVRPLRTWTNAEVLQELLYRYFALKQQQRAIQATQYFVSIIDSVLPVTHTDIERAMTLLTQLSHLPVPDAIHVATMYAHGLTHIISADKHFANLPGIVRVHPFDWPQHFQSLGLGDAKAD